jgi:hypothetical protein
LPEQDRGISSEETTLIEIYPSIKDFAADYKLKTRLGWRVVKVVAPEEPRRPGLPLCVLRRFSKRYRYHVIFVRPRF